MTSAIATNYNYDTGTLAACCKPSSGAGVVWIPPATKNGDRLKVLLLNSYFTRAQIKPEERKTEESLAQQCGAQGCGFDPHGLVVFLAILRFGTSR